MTEPQISEAVHNVAAKAIQDRLDGDRTTTGGIAFSQYFGDRAAVDALAAAVPLLEAEIRAKIAAEIFELRERMPFGDNWLTGYRSGLHDAANLAARGVQPGGSQ